MRGHANATMNRMSVSSQECWQYVEVYRCVSHCLLCVITRKSSSLAKRLRQNGNEREKGVGEEGGGVGSRETSSKTNWLEGPH